MIVTVFATARRAQDAKAYAAAVGAKSVVLFLEKREHQTYLGLPEYEDTEDKARFDLLIGTLPHWAYYVIPLGIKHPEHLTVATFAQSRLQALKRECLYYLDQPYASVQANVWETVSKMRGKRVLSYLRPGIRKYRHTKLFKAQSKFFHFNPAEKLAPNVEMIFAHSPGWPDGCYDCVLPV